MKHTHYTCLMASLTAETKNESCLSLTFTEQLEQMGFFSVRLKDSGAKTSNFGQKAMAKHVVFR